MTKSTNKLSKKTTLKTGSEDLFGIFGFQQLIFRYEAR